MGRNADTHIRVTEETWQELNQKKGPGDSFDDVITQLLDAGGDAEESNISTLVDSAVEAEADGDDPGTDMAELPETPDVGDVIDHPKLGQARVVGFEDGQILVEEVDDDDDDAVIIGGDVDDVRHPSER